VILTLSAFPLAIAGNVLRMIVVIIAADVSGQEAGEYVHDNFIFSLLPYVPAIGGVMLLGHWLRERSSDPKPELKGAKPEIL
jgi:exosortase/archaeosortase family protein